MTKAGRWPTICGESSARDRASPIPQYVAQYFCGLLAHGGILARARACDIQAAGIERREPSARTAHGLVLRTLRKVEMQQRPTEMGRGFERQKRPACKRTARNDQRRIGIAHVAHRPFGRVGRMGLFKTRVAKRYRTVLRESPLRNPA